MINFPTSLDSLTNPTAGDATTSPSHASQHANANDAIEALQAKVGVDSSAVTTSHDYKLSGVTGSDVAVSKTGTETLTNKTLTSPTINLGTNATGDIYYRDSGGAFQRLAIGSTSQVLNVDASGIPAWVSNPSASAASTTTAGIVELATTAETETGTDATRAVTPDGLHDMTTLAGAAWLLDEDDMASDSAVLVASQQSIKAYVDTNGALALGVGNATATKTYVSHQLPWLISTDVPTGNFWTVTSTTATGTMGYLRVVATGDVNNGVISTNAVASKITSGTPADLAFGDSRDVICEFTMQRNAVGAEAMGWGLSSTTAPFYSETDSTADAACFVVDASGNLYGHTSSGAGYTNSSAISGVTLTNNNIFRIELTDGTDVKFYVNGVLKATNTTNLPNSAAIKFGAGCAGSTSDNDRAVIGPVSIAVQV